MIGLLLPPSVGAALTNYALMLLGRIPVNLNYTSSNEIIASCAGSAASCMVFDEVDNGIGGAVAEIVGRELRQLGEHAQVLCVTHLPQVAAQGHQHLRVAKLSDGRSTSTSVARLSDEERVDELARMLGGVEITPRARAHAHEMLAAVAKAGAAPAAGAAQGNQADTGGVTANAGGRRSARPRPARS